MANKDNNNIVENIVDSQKKVVDSVIENTKKFTAGNDLVNETIDKSSEWYKNWLENQKNFFNKTTGQAETVKEKVEENTSKMTEFYDNWMKTQMNVAKQMWELNQQWAANQGTTGAQANANPFAAWQNNMTSQMNNWMGQMNMNNWMNQMQQMNPFANMGTANPFANMANPFANMNMANPFANMTASNPWSTDSWKKAAENMNGMFNQYQNMLTSSMSEWQKNMQPGTAQDAYKNMMGIGQSFTKFAELWTPMLKSMQDKTFNMDVYKQWMNPELYKEVMDKYFGFMPEGNREYVKNMSSMMTDGMKQMSQQGMNGYQQMRQMMNGMPGMNPTGAFGDMYGAYNNWQSMMNEAVAPFTKLMTPTQQSKMTQEWSEIANRVVKYNMKNAELQYMIYTQGTKVMDKLAENIAAKVQEGKEVGSLVSLYQEWLNMGDKVYVSLFESDEYSKLMAEVGAMQMTLRKDVEKLTEKMMVDMPVVTKSEMDEVYKTIYDLKKQVRQLEKMLEMDTEEVAAEEKTTKRTKKA